MPEKEEKEPPSHEGHRARLRARFVMAGPGSLADYELLELLLFMALPRRDVKPLAKDLLKKFGSIGDVFAAPIDELRACEGMSGNAAIALKTVEAAVARMMQTALRKAPILSSWQRLIDYCHAVMAREKVEQFRVLYLNRKNMLIADEIHQRGTVDQSAVFPREIVKRALDHGATALVLVHNHPSGDPTPSESDLLLTNEIVLAAQALGMIVIDHLIVSRTGCTSFKKRGLL